MKTLLCCVMMLFTVAAMAKDIKTLVVTTTPQMHCDNCEKKIQGNLRFERGVKRIDTSIADQTVTIQYDAEKTTPAALVKAFGKFGYTAQIVESQVKESKPSVQPSTPSLTLPQQTVSRYTDKPQGADSQRRDSLQSARK